MKKVQAAASSAIQTNNKKSQKSDKSEYPEDWK